MSCQGGSYPVREDHVLSWRIMSCQGGSCPVKDQYIKSFKIQCIFSVNMHFYVCMLHSFYTVRDNNESFLNRV